MEKKSLAPVVLFVYDRPWHTRKTVEALIINAEAKNTDLYIFSDAAKKNQSDHSVVEVRDYIQRIIGFKRVTIVERTENFGLARSITEGVTYVCQKHGRVIVLEDDIVTAPFFLKYMNDALDFYANDERVISISGYIYPVKEQLPETFFLLGADCWGWATWSRGWDIFDPDAQRLLNMVNESKVTKRFNYDGAYNFKKMLAAQMRGEIDSWAVRWYASAFLHHKLTLYPGYSLVTNIGADGSGTHFGTTDIFNGKSVDRPVSINEIEVVECLRGRSAIVSYIRQANKSFFYNRLANKIVKTIKRIFG